MRRNRHRPAQPGPAQPAGGALTRRQRVEALCDRMIARLELDDMEGDDEGRVLVLQRLLRAMQLCNEVEAADTETVDPDDLVNYPPISEADLQLLLGWLHDEPRCAGCGKHLDSAAGDGMQTNDAGAQVHNRDG